MASKAFLVLGVLLAVILVTSTEVVAREVFEYSNAEETKTTSTEGVDKYGHDGHEYGHGEHEYGHDGHEYGHGEHEYGHDGHEYGHGEHGHDCHGHDCGHDCHGHDCGHGHHEETHVEPKN